MKKKKKKEVPLIIFLAGICTKALFTWCGNEKINREKSVISARP